MLEEIEEEEENVVIEGIEGIEIGIEGIEIVMAEKEDLILEDVSIVERMDIGKRILLFVSPLKLAF